MNDRIYRKLYTADLPLVLLMDDDFRKGFICKESARLFLSDPRNWLFACIQENRIIGFAYGYELSRLDKSGNMLYIHEVGVLQKYWRQGIAAKILSCIKDCCGYLGICRIFLFTQKSNYAACALYEKIGGELTGGSNDDDRTYFFNLNNLQRKEKE